MSKCSACESAITLTNQIQFTLSYKEAEALMQAMDDINQYVTEEMFTSVRGVDSYNRAYARICKQLQSHHAFKKRHPYLAAE